ncbi:NAD-dependent epimerase/dehydratase family protein [Kinneretia aquatilis]|uniref:NAD-dependent epimerase/dehydratase family protein n=1 Tax=Kinneretia aquatilis TaxID=2070761 RepID=UPI00149542D6|nr:NAD-dependent epimerase/dehydratase family protein [Paucibacter aquatile]WIV99747.1 NAD-dependent epimerase/dehydratase family protein [Paucibacter aquatile]
MNILLCGAQGFIGRHVLGRLLSQGHSVRATSRTARPSSEKPGLEWIQADFSRELAARDWLPRLQGVDAVINAVGVLRDRPGQPMDAIHHRGPVALFEACAEAGVRRVLQISALGIAESDTQYARSKRAAETKLLALQQAGRLDATVLQPSIVFGPGGASSELFLNLARLPLLILPGAALNTRVQPVAVQDLAEACLRLLPRTGPPQLAVVGPQALCLSDFIAGLRRQQGRPPARVLRLPDALSRLSARIGDQLPFQPWGRETLALLRQDNMADPAPLRQLLDRDARSPNEFLSTWEHA